MNAYEHMKNKFTSSNSVPVEQAVVKTSEWVELNRYIISLKNRLRWAHEDLQGFEEEI